MGAAVMSWWISLACAVVGGAMACPLLSIQRLANECGHRLTLCGVAPAMKSVFTIAHIADLFQFAEDKFDAVAGSPLLEEELHSHPGDFRGRHPIYSSHGLGLPSRSAGRAIHERTPRCHH